MVPAQVAANSSSGLALVAQAVFQPPMEGPHLPTLQEAPQGVAFLHQVRHFFRHQLLRQTARWKLHLPVPLAVEPQSLESRKLRVISKSS